MVHVSKEYDSRKLMERFVAKHEIELRGPQTAEVEHVEIRGTNAQVTITAVYWMTVGELDELTSGMNE